MLNFDVKRKINTLRDILVGKVPDPKAQVEQITIALIYKFMDDMDLAGAEFGGKRVFFSGDYEKYAFTQIMLPEHSAQERLNLYAEGIDKMVNNADLPSLFRDILRGAYIPYRDPETLNRFLKEIAEFSYDNSEDLGNAFEYLLSIMGSQGDAGQFRTPRHIIDMMVEIVAPRKDETILDPACGTTGFLISAYKYIDAQNRDEEGKSTLSGDDKKRMAQNFAGYDISPDMVRLSRVNMYLHGFSNPQISEYDTLTSLEKWDDNYDVILANPPFMTPKGGISPHNRYRVSAKRAEVLFVDYIAEHLNPTGRAAIVVPEGIVFQAQIAYKNLRKMLVDGGYLYGVISLPAGVFNPYSGVKTSVLLIDRTLAKEKDSILFVKLNNDGYDLGAQRREIKGSEIPYIVDLFKRYQSGTIDDEENENIVVASKNEIRKQDYVLLADRYRKAVDFNSSWPMVCIGDAQNMIILNASKGSKKLTPFDIKNIKGRAGRYYHCFIGRVFYMTKELQEIEDSDSLALNFVTYSDNELSVIDLDNAEIEDLTSINAQRKTAREAVTQQFALPQEVFFKNRTVSKENQEKVLCLLMTTSEFNKYSPLLTHVVDVEGFLQYRWIKKILGTFCDAGLIDEITCKRFSAIANNYYEGGFKELLGYEVGQYRKGYYKTMDRAYSEAFKSLKDVLEHKIPKILSLFESILVFVANEKGLSTETFSLSRVRRYYETGVKSLLGEALIEYGFPTDAIRRIEEAHSKIKSMPVMDAKDYCRHHFREIQSLLDTYEWELFIKAMRTF